MTGQFVLHMDWELECLRMEEALICSGRTGRSSDLRHMLLHPGRERVPLRPLQKDV